jgi:hypothetical protein
MGPWPVAMVVYGRSFTFRSAVSTERALGRLRARRGRGLEEPSGPQSACGSETQGHTHSCVLHPHSLSRAYST